MKCLFILWGFEETTEFYNKQPSKSFAHHKMWDKSHLSVKTAVTYGYARAPRKWGGIQEKKTTVTFSKFSANCLEYVLNLYQWFPLGPPAVTWPLASTGTRGSLLVPKKSSFLDFWKTDYSVSLIMFGIPLPPIFLLMVAKFCHVEWWWFWKVRKNYTVNLKKNTFEIFSSLNLEGSVKKLLDQCHWWFIELSL